MSYEGIHKASSFKVGDIVCIACKSYKGEKEWPLSWTSRMNDLVGKIGKINQSDPNQGFLIEFCENNEQLAIYLFPCYVLVGSNNKEFNVIFSKTVKLINDYPHQCPHCGGPAYVGIFKVDCKQGCK